MKRRFIGFATAMLALTLSAVNAQGEGQQLYEQHCAVCHGAEGQGGIGPALAGNQELQDAAYHINQILHGGGEMPAFAEQLSDEQVAAVATYERTSWGNDFGEITAQQVAQQREAGTSQTDDTEASDTTDAGTGDTVSDDAQTESEEPQTGSETDEAAADSVETSEPSGTEASETSSDEATDPETEGSQVEGQQTDTQQPSQTQQAQGQVDVGLELVAEGFVSPVSLVSPPDDERRFVVDRVGYIYILDENGERLEEPFLDLTDRIVELRENFDERGLLGLAFHPNFAENGRFYVYYSAPLREEAPDDWDHTSHISEFKVSEDNPDLANPNSERILLKVDEPQFNHNAGALAFGPEDGYLYIALGDGGAGDDQGIGHPPGGNGQDIYSLLGDILRIDVDHGWPGYAIPPNNPFVGKQGADEIYAWGWRNPWRMSFDTGGDHDLFVATNGQNLWESVYIVDQPGNYGWNRLEGTHCFDPDAPDTSPEECDRVGPRGEPLLEPVIEYPHLANQGDSEVAGISVIGGYVYRGSALPELQGRYVFGDWSSSFNEPHGQVLMATRTRNAGELWELEQLEQLEVYVLGFGQDSSGELYVLTTESTGPTGMTGKVHKIIPAQSGNQPQEGQPQGESEAPSQETPQTEPEATPEDTEDQQ